MAFMKSLMFPNLVADSEMPDPLQERVPEHRKSIHSDGSGHTAGRTFT